MSDRVILTTSSHLEGYRVTEHIDIVSAECVFGMNILKLKCFTKMRALQY